MQSFKVITHRFAYRRRSSIRCVFLGLFFFMYISFSSSLIIVIRRARVSILIVRVGGGAFVVDIGLIWRNTVHVTLVTRLVVSCHCLLNNVRTGCQRRLRLLVRLNIGRSLVIDILIVVIVHKALARGCYRLIWRIDISKTNFM